MQAGRASANIHQLCNSCGKALWNCQEGSSPVTPSPPPPPPPHPTKNKSIPEQQIDCAPYEKGLVSSRVTLA